MKVLHNKLSQNKGNQVSISELGDHKEIVATKLPSVANDRLKALTCKFALVHNNGETYICVHKSDRNNPSLKQLLQKEKPREFKEKIRDDEFQI